MHKLLLNVGVASTLLASSLSIAAQDGDKSNFRVNSDQIIINFKSDNNKNRAMRLQSLTGREAKFVRKTLRGKNIMRFSKRLTAEEMQNVMQILQNHPEVESVQIDAMMQPTATPNDSLYANQWHYFEQTGGLNLESAWDTATGNGVVVAVLDTGYLPHADLVDNLLPGVDMISTADVGNDGDGRDADASDPGDWTTFFECGFGWPGYDSSWHGTHVAGTVAATTNNSTGVAGVAYNAKIVPVRVLGTCGGYTSDIADGIIWAAGGTVGNMPVNPNPAQVINLSLGGSGGCDSVTQNAINEARALGATVVVAAGNSNADASNYSPASCNGVISVAATDRNGARAPYSNYGNVVDVAAPGGAQTFAGDPLGVLSTLNSGATTPANDIYEYYQGTSMAAPHVAGAAALLYEADPSITPDAVEAALVDSARSFPASCSQCGSGIVDATAALASLDGGGTDPGPGGYEQTITDISGARRTNQFFVGTLPAGMSTLTVTTTGGTGDINLHVRYGANPTGSQYDCRSRNNGSNEEVCVIDNPQAGDWHIRIRGRTDYSGVTLTAVAE